MNSKRPVNKVIYAVLAFFLGGFGVHEFYAQHTMAGILSLLFCWTMVPSLVAFIKFIMAIFSPADAQGNIYM